MPAAPIDIVRRHVEIDFAAVPPGPWFPPIGPLETMFHAASIAFPVTERFFIASVRAYEREIADPALREQVRAFVHQEAMHNKVHIDWNNTLARSNPRVRRAERASEITFAILGRLPRALRLSLSSALEHFTAMIAEMLLRHPREYLQIVPPEIARMWMWHAAEETEHKAVCFDVHQAVLGRGVLSYLNRVFGMLLATPIFAFVMIGLGSLLLGRPRRGTPGTLNVNFVLPEGSDARRFAGRGIVGLAIHVAPWRQYFSYYRPSFHPWDHDNSPLVAEWQARYPGFGLAGR